MFIRLVALMASRSTLAPDVFNLALTLKTVWIFFSFWDEIETISNTINIIKGSIFNIGIFFRIEVAVNETRG